MNAQQKLDLITTALNGSYRDMQNAVKELRSLGYDTPKVNSSSGLLTIYLEGLQDSIREWLKAQEPAQGCNLWVEFKTYLMFVLGLTKLSIYPKSRPVILYGAEAIA
jgi:hypothetical protein